MGNFHLRARFARHLEALAAAAILFGLGVPGALSDELGPDPTASAGWAYQVFMRNLYKVDNILIGEQGEIYATIESQSQGRIVRLSNGERFTVAAGLHRPDGLAMRWPYLYVTEEVDQGRVIQIDLRDFSRNVLANLDSPEGIDVLPDGGLIVAEDRGGRIVTLARNGKIEVLVRGLRRPEGLAISPSGTVYIAETKTGRILAMTDEGLETVLAGLTNPDQVEVASDSALWITEDAKPGRLLRYFAGRLEVVMSGLMAPQGIAFGRNGDVYVAEQGRNRILVLSRTASD